MARPALIFAFLVAAGLPAAAQQPLPETPPELRDFRLDPERAQQQPGPERQAEVTSPPVAPTQPQAQPPSSARPQPTPSQPSAPARTRNAPAVNEQPRQPVPAEEAPPTKAEPVVVPEMVSAEPEVPASPDPRAERLAWWQLVAAAVFAALILLAFAWFRLRRKSAQQVATVAAESTGSGAIAPLPPILPIPAILPSQAAEKRAKLTLEFIPETATLSFTALTVRGQLRLINVGDVTARNMLLRATLLSANRQQEKMLAAFHSGTIDVPEEPIGEAKIGERIAMQIEMSLPMAELQSFEVQSRRIMVPVMVANLAYEWDGGRDVVKLACLVGKEAQPPAPKMAPFRLDLGPRRFAPLGQRPLYT
ncbi:MAG: hypothetical protein IBJ12_03270 [Sphingomonadaceae bacterium]|nr:hypothetical protein [Sphingomonadaceae bacterium]